MSSLSYLSYHGECTKSHLYHFYIASYYVSLDTSQNKMYCSILTFYVLSQVGQGLAGLAFRQQNRHQLMHNTGD